MYHDARTTCIHTHTDVHTYKTHSSRSLGNTDARLAIPRRFLNYDAAIPTFLQTVKRARVQPHRYTITRSAEIEKESADSGKYTHRVPMFRTKRRTEKERKREREKKTRA